MSSCSAITNWILEMHYVEVLYKSQKCEVEKKFKKHYLNIQIGRANFEDIVRRNIFPP